MCARVPCYKMALLNKYKFYIAGAVLGAIGGYLYYYFVGCASGTCAITSNPLNSTVYGAIMGSLLLSMLDPESKK